MVFSFSAHTLDQGHVPGQEIGAPALVVHLVLNLGVVPNLNPVPLRIRASQNQNPSLARVAGNYIQYFNDV